MSVDPPGVNGTMMRTGRDGYPCALPMRKVDDSTIAPTARRRNWRREGFIPFPPQRAMLAASDPLRPPPRYLEDDGGEGSSWLLCRLFRSLCHANQSVIDLSNSFMVYFSMRIWN